MIMLLVNITQNHDPPYIFFISFSFENMSIHGYKNVLQMVFHVCFEKKYRNKKNLTHMIHWLCFRNTWEEQIIEIQRPDAIIAFSFFFIKLAYLKGTAIVIQLHIENATVYQHFELKLSLTVQK